MTINTKVEINEVEYTDIINIVINKSIGQFNGTSSFKLEFDNPAGRYSDTFVLNQEVKIYADKDVPATTLIFTGLIEDKMFDGDGLSEKLTLRGRDFGLAIQNTFVQPRIFKDQEVSKIVKDIMEQNISAQLISVNNVNTTSTTLDKITFSNMSVFEVLKQLAELSEFIFYIDEDKDLHFEEKDAIVSGITFDNTNTIRGSFNKTDREVFNKVTVYGDKILTGEEEYFKVAGSVYNLNYKPENTSMFLSGTTDVIYQPGGIFGLTDPSIQLGKYLVDFQGQRIIFTSGTKAGDNIPATGSIVARYDRNLSIIKIKANITSQLAYGLKETIVIDQRIKDPDEAAIKASTILNNSKGAETEGNILVKGIIDITPGNTAIANFPFQGVNNDVFTIENASYNFNTITTRDESVLTMDLSRRAI